MTKFQDLIDLPVPVLLVFYSKSDPQTAEMNAVLQQVSGTMANRAKLIKIDSDKNPELASALRIEGITFLLYKRGDMKWRQSGMQSGSALTDLLQNHI